MSEEYQEDYKQRKLVDKEGILEVLNLEAASSPEVIIIGINGLVAEGYKLLPAHPRLAEILHNLEKDDGYIKALRDMVLAHFAASEEEEMEETANKVDEVINSYDVDLL